MTSVRPSELELQILSVLWQKGPASVRTVRSAIPDGKERAYTSVLSVMQTMEKKGLLGHEREGTTHIYHPLVERVQVLPPLLSQLVRNVFGGSPAQALQCLLDGTDVDDDEMRRIRTLIDEYEAEPSTGDDQ
ncbi:MAG: CopY family transcriptional regulator [Planctomycetaceae bacterium]|nr:CopY family transcriptional regulator [Planctomycetaceae bacterium]